MYSSNASESKLCTWGYATLERKQHPSQNHCNSLNGLIKRDNTLTNCICAERIRLQSEQNNS
jgi:hypothetical protein